jgi:hypothetical protein
MRKPPKNLDTAPRYCACGCGKITNISRDTGKGRVRGRYNKYCNGHNHKGETGSLSTTWKGGRVSTKHVLKAREVLGKSLPKGTVVHHHSKEQLVICENQAYHLLLHQRTRALKACGNANWRKCYICKKYDEPRGLSIPSMKGRQAYHKCCMAKHVRRITYKQKEKPIS